MATLFKALCLVLVFAGWSTVALGLEVSEIIERVQARYDATHDFTAKVIQKLRVASLDKTLTTEGTVAFKKPGRMRWEFKEDDPQIIVADGTTLWFYRPEEQQVFKAPFDSAFRSTTPISFLTGVGRIAQDFDITLNGQSVDGKLLYLQLIPKRDAGDVGVLRLRVTSDTADIRGAEVYDPLGNVSILEFEDLRRNLGLTDERFEFEVPAGVDVISAPLAE
jgi:outer membrane lipoprotein carrier protein